MLCTSQSFHVGILVRDVEGARASSPPDSGSRSDPVPPPAARDRRDDQVLLLPPGTALPRAGRDHRHRQLVAEQPEGFHHIGLSDPDMPARCAAFGPGVELIAPRA